MIANHKPVGEHEQAGALYETAPYKCLGAQQQLRAVLPMKATLKSYACVR
jgi:hypothetical protein